MFLNLFYSPSGTPERVRPSTQRCLVEEAARPWWYMTGPHGTLWGSVLWQFAVQWIAGFNGAAFIHTREFLVTCRVFVEVCGGLTHHS